MGWISNLSLVVLCNLMNGESWRGVVSPKSFYHRFLVTM